jgi:hypothetical protein
MTFMPNNYGFFSLLLIKNALEAKTSEYASDMLPIWAACPAVFQ